MLYDPNVRITFLGAVLATFTWYVSTAGSDQMAIQRYLATRTTGQARVGLWVGSLGVVPLSRQEIIKALTGHYRSEHLFSLRQALQLYDVYSQAIKECDAQMKEQYQSMAGLDDDSSGAPMPPLPPLPAAIGRCSSSTASTMVRTASNG